MYKSLLFGDVELFDDDVRNFLVIRVKILLHAVRLYVIDFGVGKNQPNQSQELFQVTPYGPYQSYQIMYQPFKIGHTKLHISCTTIAKTYQTEELPVSLVMAFIFMKFLSMCALQIPRHSKQKNYQV